MGWNIEVWKTSGDYSFHPEFAVEKADDNHFDEIPQAIAKIALGADYNEKVFNEWRISYRQTKPENKKLEGMRPRLRALFETFAPLLADGAQRHKCIQLRLDNHKKNDLKKGLQRRGAQRCWTFESLERFGLET